MNLESFLNLKPFKFLSPYLDFLIFNTKLSHHFFYDYYRYHTSTTKIADPRPA